MKKELSKIYLWEQYKRNDGLVGYFDFFRNYLNENYKDLFYKSVKNENGKVVDIEAGKLLKEFSINEAESDYLDFYLKNIYNIKRPHYLVDKQFWDDMFNWDSYYIWDAGDTAELVPIYLLRKLFTWMYNVKHLFWNIPNLASMLAEFIEEPIHKIKIYRDKNIGQDILKTYTVELPNNRYSNDFRIVYNTYANIFNLPIGVKLIVKVIS